VWGAAGPDVFDCSGLMSWGLTHAGAGIGRLTADDFWQTFPRIASGAVQAGDLVLFGARYGTSGMAGHIGLVIDPAQHLMMHTYTDTGPATISHYDSWDLSNGGPLGFVQAIPDTGTAAATTPAAPACWWPPDERPMDTSSSVDGRSIRQLLRVVVNGANFAGLAPPRQRGQAVSSVAKCHGRWPSWAIPRFRRA